MFTLISAAAIAASILTSSPVPAVEDTQTTANTSDTVQVELVNHTFGTWETVWAYAVCPDSHPRLGVPEVTVRGVWPDGFSHSLNPAGNEVYGLVTNWGAERWLGLDINCTK